MDIESQARMDEYVEGRRLSQKAIIKEINGEKDKEIERLKKEKEWLKYQILLYQEFHPGLPHDEKMELLEVDIQQALKEGE